MHWGPRSWRRGEEGPSGIAQVGAHVACEDVVGCGGAGDGIDPPDEAGLDQRANDEAVLEGGGKSEEGDGGYADSGADEALAGRVVVDLDGEPRLEPSGGTEAQERLAAREERAAVGRDETKPSEVRQSDLGRGGERMVGRKHEEVGVGEEELPGEPTSGRFGLVGGAGVDDVAQNDGHLDLVAAQCTQGFGLLDEAQLQVDVRMATAEPAKGRGDEAGACAWQHGHAELPVAPVNERPERRFG